MVYWPSSSLHLSSMVKHLSSKYRVGGVYFVMELSPLVLSNRNLGKIINCTLQAFIDLLPVTYLFHKSKVLSQLQKRFLVTIKFNTVILMDLSFHLAISVSPWADQIVSNWWFSCPVTDKTASGYIISRNLISPRTVALCCTSGHPDIQYSLVLSSCDFLTAHDHLLKKDKLTLWCRENGELEQEPLV